MEALRILSDEHQSLAAILHAVRFMLREVQAGRLQPDLALFQAMVHYLDAYAEQSHHPKEDLLFAVLPKRTSAGASALETLAVQHAAAPQRIAALERAMSNLLADPSRLDEFAQAFETYADFYRGHMVTEEETVFPLARRHLTEEDWKEVDAAFKVEMKKKARDLSSERQEEFTALFSRLVACAPAPVGLGVGPYTAPQGTGR